MKSKINSVFSGSWLCNFVVFLSDLELRPLIALVLLSLEGGYTLFRNKSIYRIVVVYPHSNGTESSRMHLSVEEVWISTLHVALDDIEFLCSWATPSYGLKLNGKTF